MYKQCVTEQSASRQRAMEEGLLAAMCTKQYDSITVSDLCASMNIPRKSFYRYFSSKEGALYALIDHMILDFSGEVFADEEKATIQTLERFFEFWKKNRTLLDALQRSGLGGVLVMRSIARAMDEDTLTKNLISLSSVSTREYMVNFLVSGLISMILQWHSLGFNVSAREMAQMAANLMTHPLLDVSWGK